MGSIKALVGRAFLVGALVLAATSVTSAASATSAAPAALPGCGCYGFAILWTDAGPNGDSSFGMYSTKPDTWQYYTVAAIDFPNDKASAIDLYSTVNSFKCETRYYRNIDHSGGTLSLDSGSDEHLASKGLYYGNHFTNLATKKFSNGVAANDQISSVAIWCANFT